ncbi:MAG: squalene/phytoene synthase family protein [Acidimicrobiaceae bacterium]|nr:squalene/phytoene synthase family protein [Acidimicrobiaceae bacterium]
MSAAIEEPGRPTDLPGMVEAYARCEEITRAEARNFSYGIRLLRPPERRAMSALYAMARRIDDIGDGDDPRAAKLDALHRVRADLDAVAPGAAPQSDDDAWRVAADPVLVALGDVSRRYPIPMKALHELVDGCQMDVEGTRYRTFDELVGYCRRVAGTVGRLSLGIYGCDDPERAEPLADALGVALQITNILRDIVEDRDTMGRVYLPAEDLERFGLDGEVRGTIDDVCALVSFEAGRAEDWYAEGLTLLPMLDRRSRACTAAMAGIYHRLLRRIQRDPAAVLAGRLSLPASEKATAAGRALLWGTV